MGGLVGLKGVTGYPVTTDSPLLKGRYGLRFSVGTSICRTSIDFWDNIGTSICRTSNRKLDVYVCVV